ncbi:MAG: hypothetical protein GXO76_11705 [Calditrichaeota bacterium]|nr:hypothetical protein [Calditrichota bacterium]
MSVLFAGLDVSTQSCKLVVIDWDLQRVVYTDSVQYDVDLPQYGTKMGVIPGLGEGVSESDPQMWLDAVQMAFTRLRNAGLPVEAIRSISVSGQQHGLVSLDAQGNLTRSRSKLWNDFSTQEECDILTRRVGGKEAMIREIGNTQRTGYTAAKIFHMFRHEREAYDRTATFFLVHNFINWYLTGGGHNGVRVMEPGDTSGTALWNPVTGQWSQKVIEAIDPGLQDKLPPVLPSDKSIGNISQDLVHTFGFSADCRIDAGSGDNMYGAVGTGNVRPGIVTVSLGTSGTAYTVLTEPYVDPEGEIAAFCDSTGQHLPLLCVSNMANGYVDFLKEFNLSHDEFTRLIRKTASGNGGRLLIPWFEGERTPDVPKAAPVHLGFRTGDFTKEILARAILEGHILNLYYGFQRMPVKPKEIRLTGGLSKSEAWQQGIADVFEAETVPVEGEGAALGAALHAAWVWQKENGRAIPLETLVQPFVKRNEEQRKKPIAKNVQVYQKQKELYTALVNRILGRAAGNPFDLRAGMPVGN